MIRGGDFYEDDEPVDQVIAAFESGDHGTTGGLARGYNFELGPDGQTRPAKRTSSGRAVLRHSGKQFLHDVAEAVVERAHARSEAEQEPTVKFPDVRVQLTGRDGNVFSIIGAVAAALKRAGHQVEAEEFANQAMDSSAYHDVLALVQRTVEVS